MSATLPAASSHTYRIRIARSNSQGPRLSAKPSGTIAARGHSPNMSTGTQMIAKWRRWLHRIENDQLQDLLVNRHIFHQFRDCIATHADSDRGADLASWMAQNYV